MAGQQSIQVPSLTREELVGVGLRHQHFDYLSNHSPTSVGWFEIISENFMETEGRPMHYLERIRRDFPVAMHGVSLSIAGTTPISKRYLERLKHLIDRIQPLFVSDHLCWTGLEKNNLHNLLPFPYRSENLQWVAQRVQEVQDYIQRPLALENLSAYLHFAPSDMSEQDFLLALCQQTGCKILLDLNNVHVNACNFHFQSAEFFRVLKPTHISHLHLAGHSDMGTHLFDTHSRPVAPEVWQLYRSAIQFLGPLPTLIEWDEDIPDFPILENEANIAGAILQEVCL